LRERGIYIKKGTDYPDEWAMEVLSENKIHENSFEWQENQRMRRLERKGMTG